MFAIPIPAPWIISDITRRKMRFLITIVVALVHHHFVVEVILRMVVTAVATHLLTARIVLVVMTEATVAVHHLPATMGTGGRVIVTTIRRLVGVVAGPQ